MLVPAQRKLEEIKNLNRYLKKYVHPHMEFVESAILNLEVHLKSLTVQKKYSQPLCVVCVYIYTHNNILLSTGD